MPTYDYEIISTKEIVEVTQSIKDDALTEIYSPKKKKMLPCRRQISYNYAGVVYKGDGWTMKNAGHGARGYKGKFQDKIRPKGAPVDAPANKAEADRQFQRHIDSGGLDGIKPSMEFKAGNAPQTTEQMLDKKFKPKGQ